MASIPWRSPSSPLRPPRRSGSGLKPRIGIYVTAYREPTSRIYVVHVRSRTDYSRSQCYSRTGKSAHVMALSLSRNQGDHQGRQAYTDGLAFKVVNEVVCGVHPLPPCTFLGYVRGLGALTSMYVGSEQCSYFAYFEQSTDPCYIIHPFLRAPIHNGLSRICIQC